MIDLTCTIPHRSSRIPVWIVSRAYRRPDGVIFFRPIGKFRAWTQDEAIKAGAFAVERLAILKAERAR